MYLQSICNTRGKILMLFDYLLAHELSNTLGGQRSVCSCNSFYSNVKIKYNALHLINHKDDLLWLLLHLTLLKLGQTNTHICAFLSSEVPLPLTLWTMFPAEATLMCLQHRSSSVLITAAWTAKRRLHGRGVVI